MDIRFERIASIVDVDFSDKANLTFLIGDNGVGKTFLLEAYSRANDYLVEKFVDSGYFNNLTEKLDIKIDSCVLANDNKHVYKRKITESNNNGYRARFQIDANLRNIFVLEDELIKDLKEEESKLKKVIQQEIFLNELETDGFELNINSSFHYLEGIQSYNLNLDIRSENITFTSEVDNSIHFGDTYSYMSLSKSGSKRVLRRMLQQDEAQNILKEIKEGNYNKVVPIIKRLISIQIKDSFIKENDLKNIIYIPSERVISMSATLERILNREKFNELRYSEKKFMQHYSLVKDALAMLSVDSFRKLEFSDEYKELVGGVPLFNEEGELSFIEDGLGNKIKRSLFSTKQNKLSPFFMLESQFYPFLHNKNLNKLNNIIIIEEPEAHLSLKGITQMARYICHLAENRNVIISTHSDVLLSRVNNIYVDKKRLFTLNGYEIIEKKPFNLFKTIELTELGLRSDFIEEQLCSLISETNNVQSEINLTRDE